MASKFYYTVRELSARAPEMFAWHSMQGEVVTDQDPWVIVQDGYAHEWNTHGGSAFLHQHMVNSYGACWQQQLSNGEIDPSVCVRGVSRIFNYYLAGLDWSFAQAPFINGIYYDGISFTHDAMLRIRRVADAAAVAAGKGFPALLDLHSGRSQPPEICSYYGIYPLSECVAPAGLLLGAATFCAQKRGSCCTGTTARLPARRTSLPPYPLSAATSGTARALTFPRRRRTGSSKSPTSSTALPATRWAAAKTASGAPCSSA